MSGKIYDYPELLEGDEELLPFAKACKEFRPPVSIPTINRYSSDGIRNAVLRTVKIGGTRCTTLSEIKRFSLAQLGNPVPPCNESTKDAPKRSTRKTGSGMTADEISAGLARHGLE